MLAYRFLAKGAVGSLNGFAWPTPSGGDPGSWIGASADSTALGVFAHRVRDLPHWLNDELWEVELRGEVRTFDYQLVAQEARLVRKLPEWDDRVGEAFATACAERLRARAITFFNLHGLASMADEIGAASLSDCPTVLGPIDPAVHGEVPALVAGYLNDAIAALSGKRFGAVSYIAQVASIDHRLSDAAGLPDRDLQAEWIGKALSVDSTPKRET
jgi:hypothetical protein